MEKSKIFIASSGRAIGLAEILRDELSTDFCEACIWSEESKNKISLTIIEMLEKASKEFDFAVVILIRDDVDFRETGDEAQRKAVYNCIFEAGLFMGTRGRERCFLVTDVKSSDLPVYLNGIIYAPFDGLKDLTNREECRKAVLKTSVAIKDAVQRMGRLIERECLPLLSVEELFKREKSIVDGGDLDEGLVVVADLQPRVRYEFAAQVKRNLDHGVRYVYFFPANIDGAQKICWLLQMVLLAELFKDIKEADSFQNRLKVIRENRDRVRSNLQEICTRDSLNICFMQDDPALQFRIHNATSREKAKLYLSYGRGFIEWVGGERAVNMWSYMKQWYIESKTEAIFHSTTPLMVDRDREGRFKNSLIEELKRHFPEIHEEVTRLCYGEKDSEQ